MVFLASVFHWIWNLLYSVNYKPSKKQSSCLALSTADSTMKNRPVSLPLHRWMWPSVADEIGASHFFNSTVGFGLLNTFLCACGLRSSALRFLSKNIDFSKDNSKKEGWRDDPVVKQLTVQAWGAEFNSQDPGKVLGKHRGLPVVQACRRCRWGLLSRLTSKLAETVSSRFSRWKAIQDMPGVNLEPPHMCIYEQVHLHIFK